MRRVVNRTSVAALAALVCLMGGWRLTLSARAAQQPAPPPPGVDPALLSTFKWRSIGPERGGRSIAISGVKGHPEVGYFGATGGGLWKTTDKGASWVPVTDGQIHSSSVGAVAVSESNTDEVFIGTGESCIRGNIQPGDGVYKSTDAGKTWTRVGFEKSDAISKIRIDPTNPDIVFVADFGKYSVPSDERGVYKSVDGGKTWKRVLFRDANTGAVDLWIDHNNPKVVFAALWEAFRKEYTMSSGGPGSGLFKSTDGGETWTEITHNPGLPSGIDGKIGVSVSGADSTRVYALVENASGGVFVSNDAGATWAQTNRQRDLRQRAFYYTHITADPHNKDLVYAQDVGTWKSSDGGNTFSQYAGSDSHDIWIDPDDSNHFMYANDGGGTETFTALTQPVWSSRAYATGQFYHVITTANVPYHVCGAQQDSSTICVPSDAGLGFGGGRRGGGGGGNGRGAGGGPADPLAGTYNAGGAEPGYIAPDPNDPDVFYAGGNNGSFLTKINRRTGEDREVGPYPLEFSGQASKDLVERVQWTFPIIFSQVDTHVLFTGTQHLWRSTNGGQSWDKLGGDQLTRHDPKTMGDSGGPITHDMNSPEVYATVFAIGPGKTDVNVVWTGSDDGIVSVTRDGGKTFANVTPKDMPDLGRVSIIDASKFDAASAYVAVKKPLLDDQHPYIFRTHDFGRTWTKIVNGLGPTDYVHSVREDPTRKGLLYAGTEHGIYYSYDDGDTWRSLALNLPDTQISDIWVEANDLTIATHGRGFYILDNIGPIRQYGVNFVSAKSVFLFKPNDAIRSATTATIAYWVKDAPQSVTIDIVDPKGNVAHAFSNAPAAAAGRGGRAGGGGGGRAAGAGAGGGAPAPAAAGGNNSCAPGGGGGFGGRGGRGGATGPDPLPTAPGLNCVSWSLRYANAVDFPNDIMWGGGTTGPLAAPGTYQVKMTVDGVTQTQALVVKRHPLYKEVSDADLQAQFDLAIQVRDKVSEANQAVIDIRHVKTEVADRLSKSQDAGLKTAGDTLTANLSAVEQDIYQVKNEAGQDPLNFPIKTNNRLGSLLEMIDHGDGKPIGNAPVVFADLKLELKGETDRLAKVIATDLVAFNTEAKRLGLDPVTVK